MRKLIIKQLEDLDYRICQSEYKVLEMQGEEFYKNFTFYTEQEKHNWLIQNQRAIQSELLIQQSMLDQWGKIVKS